MHQDPYHHSPRHIGCKVELRSVAISTEGVFAQVLINGTSLFACHYGSESKQNMHVLRSRWTI